MGWIHRIPGFRGRVEKSQEAKKPELSEVDKAAQSLSKKAGRAPLTNFQRELKATLAVRMQRKAKRLPKAERPPVPSKPLPPLSASEGRKPASVRQVSSHETPLHRLGSGLFKVISAPFRFVGWVAGGAINRVRRAGRAIFGSTDATLDRLLSDKATPEDLRREVPRLQKLWEQGKLDFRQMGGLVQLEIELEILNQVGALEEKAIDLETGEIRLTSQNEWSMDGIGEELRNLTEQLERGPEGGVPVREKFRTPLLERLEQMRSIHARSDFLFSSEVPISELKKVADQLEQEIHELPEVLRSNKPLKDVMDQLQSLGEVPRGVPMLLPTETLKLYQETAEELQSLVPIALEERRPLETPVSQLMQLKAEKVFAALASEDVSLEEFVKGIDWLEAQKSEGLLTTAQIKELDSLILKRDRIGVITSKVRALEIDLTKEGVLWSRENQNSLRDYRRELNFLKTELQSQKLTKPHLVKDLEKRYQELEKLYLIERTKFEKLGLRQSLPIQQHLKNLESLSKRFSELEDGLDSLPLKEALESFLDLYKENPGYFRRLSKSQKARFNKKIYPELMALYEFAKTSPERRSMTVGELRELRRQQV